MSSHGTSPWPVETKSQPRRGSPHGRCEDRPPLRPLPSASGVLAVDVVDPVGEVADEPDRIEVLPHHVARVPVEPERLAVADRLERAPRRPVVVGDLGRMHLVREPHAALVEHVEDRIPRSAKSWKPASIRSARTGGNIATYGQMDDPVKPTTVSTPSARPAARCSSFLPPPAADALGVAVAPHARRQDRLVPEVDGSSHTACPTRWLEIAYTLESVPLEDLATLVEVAVLVPAPGRGGRPSTRSRGRRSPSRPRVGDLRERQVGPLAGEPRVRRAHQETPSIDRSILLPGNRAPLSSIAASTRCTANPSAKDGDGSPPLPRSQRGSRQPGW